MIIELKRLVEDTVFFTSYIKIKAINMVRSYDSYRIDLPDLKQVEEITKAGFKVDRDQFHITMGQFIDLLHKIYHE